MFARFICPHCHAPIDPRVLDVAECHGTSCRICYECDGLIVQSRQSPLSPPAPSGSSTDEGSLPLAEAVT